MRVTSASLSAILLLACAAGAQQTPPAKHRVPVKAPMVHALRLAPQLIPGQILHYQVELRTTTASRQEGLVQDPQAASQLEISWTAVVRVEILSKRAAPPAAKAPGKAPVLKEAVRIRTTYEHSSAKVQSDIFDPAAALMEKQYQNLEGNSIEFTVNADGTVTDVKGLEDVVTDQQAATAARQWVTQLVSGVSSPGGGIVPGQHWTSEKPAESAPITGIVWRTDSTYVRDEACNPMAAAPADEACAVILTRLEMNQPKPLREQTPDDYRKRGLHTAGTWQGSGESLSYISRHTGWVVSSTQSGTEEMNVTITSVSTASTVRYAGKVRSESHITLLPETPAKTPR